jgi:hypothetical protein
MGVAADGRGHRFKPCFRYANQQLKDGTAMIMMTPGSATTNDALPARGGR